MQTEGKVHSLWVLSPGMLLDMIQLSVLVLPAQRSLEGEVLSKNVTLVSVT